MRVGEAPAVSLQKSTSFRLEVGEAERNLQCRPGPSRRLDELEELVVLAPVVGLAPE